jgi:hypothetical protein
MDGYNLLALHPAKDRIAWWPAVIKIHQPAIFIDETGGSILSAVHQRLRRVGQSHLSGQALLVIFARKSILR